MPRKLLLFPFGGNTREALMTVFAINEKRVEWEIMGFIHDDPAMRDKDCCGIKVLGGRTILADIPDAYVLAIPGSPTSYPKRKDVIESLHLDQTRFATIIHPSVERAPDATIGYNTVVMPNVVVSCGARIGNHCIVLPNSVFSHDSKVHDYCCVGSNVSVSGSVSIGTNCYIGSGTKMRENVSIGEFSLVGLGSIVVSDIPSGVIAAGSPAKVIKKIIA